MDVKIAYLQYGALNLLVVVKGECPPHLGNHAVMAIRPLAQSGTPGKAGGLVKP